MGLRGIRTGREPQQHIGGGGGVEEGGGLIAFQERWGQGCEQLLEAVDFELLLLGQVNLQTHKHGGGIKMRTSPKRERHTHTVTKPVPR